jgi:excisionase family DNA binding protein
MNHTEIERLTKAIANLTTVLIETTVAKVREQNPVATSPPSQIKKAMDNLMTKKDVAAYLKISLGTVNHLMRKGHLPYIKLGPRFIRFMPSNVEEAMKRRCNVGV